MNIEIIGSLDGKQYYSSQQVNDLLEEEHTELSYGEAFMGRPGTRLYAGLNEIVKLRTELDLNEDKARRFVNHTLEQEQKIGVHHPHKTWFLIEFEDNKLKIGNICPRITPIHTLEEGENCQLSDKIDYLKQIYRCYFEIASRFSLRLDEGLSNFGIDKDKTLYYLDDDLYSWDKFISFSHLLGVLIRNNNWLDEACAIEFGSTLQQLIGEFFEDSHTGYMVARQLRDIFMPDNDRRRVLETIIEQLEQRKIVRKKVKPHNDEYLAILSDVHANLPALNAVLDYLEQHNIAQGMVLGDTVGYGPHPTECIERLQKTQLTVIKGNHDHAAASGDTKRGMSSTARWCIEWTIPRLTASHTQWLSDLPLELSSDDNADKSWRAMHGAPIDPNYFYAYVYEMTYEQNLDVMEQKHMDLCFHGHSHIQGLYARNKSGIDSFLNPDAKISLANYKHALICSGAVGQPRDGCKGAQFALYNQRNHEIEFKVVDYDMSKTLTDLQKYEFPEMLGERLQRGA
ncbi:MAG: hypothetical protein GQ569_05965 [Methylococcaceae bacterium]|nr:hypothetical protein [Methylococcaceae bacterium]